MSLLRDLFDLFRSEPDHPATRNPKSKPATRKPARRQKTIVHPIVGEVTLSQSRRARRISLCVRPSGPVRLSYLTASRPPGLWNFWKAASNGFRQPGIE